MIQHQCSDGRVQALGKCVVLLIVFFFSCLFLVCETVSFVGISFECLLACSVCCLFFCSFAVSALSLSFCSINGSVISLPDVNSRML